MASPGFSAARSCTAAASSTTRQGLQAVLLHGLLDSSLTWRKLAPVLALGHTVIAVDLLGQRESDDHQAVDYSLGGTAAMLRDLLDELGHERATVVGALARGRHRDDLRLPLPGAHRAAGADLQRRARRE